MTEVVVTDEFAAWYEGLSDQDRVSVARSIENLEARGTSLPFPHSSAIKGSRYALRELRTQSGGRPLRTFYAFDPKRQAVLLIGGDKTGDDRFYLEMVRKAEGIWEQYLGETGQQ